MKTHTLAAIFCIVLLGAVTCHAEAGREYEGAELQEQKTSAAATLPARLEIRENRIVPRPPRSPPGSKSGKTGSSGNTTRGFSDSDIRGANSIICRWPCCRRARNIPKSIRITSS